MRRSSLSVVVAIELPLADPFLWGTAKAQPSPLRSAACVAPARIDGSVTDQYAFRVGGGFRRR